MSCSLAWLALTVAAAASERDALDEAIAQHKRGAALWEPERLEWAEKALRRAMPLQPHRETEVRFYLGATASAFGRHAEAVAQYGAVLRLDPLSVESEENRAISLSAASRLEEAAASYERAVALSPSAARYSSLGQLRMRLSERHAGASDAFVSALRLAPSGARVYYEVARASQLFGGDGRSSPVGEPAFRVAQALAVSQWREAMGCAPLGGGDAYVPVGEWRGGALASLRTLNRGNRASYGDARWAAAGSGWPPLAFSERDVWIAELNDVWISGNDGVVTSEACALYLPSHGAQAPAAPERAAAPHDAHGRRRGALTCPPRLAVRCRCTTTFRTRSRPRACATARCGTWATPRARRPRCSSASCSCSRPTSTRSPPTRSRASRWRSAACRPPSARRCARHCLLPHTGTASLS
jgi:Flp pilus assembly protein TadD